MGVLCQIKSGGKWLFPLLAACCWVGCDIISGDEKASFFVARYRVDGTRDSTFQKNGVAYAAFTTTRSAADPQPFKGINAKVDALIIDHRMRVVAAGCTRNRQGRHIALVRFLEGSGALDRDFARNGKQLYSDEMGNLCEAKSVAVDTDNRILTAGFVQKREGPDFSDFVLICCNEAGELDPAFGLAGFATTTFHAVLNEAVYSVRFIGGNRLLAAGSGEFHTGRAMAVAARFDRYGQLDRSYGIDGRIITPFTGYADARITDMAIDSAGRIVAIGNATIRGRNQLVMVRFHSNGAPDRSFGPSGVVTLTPNGMLAERTGSLALYSDGRILVAGEALSSRNENRILLARFLADGTLDRSFGNQGRVLKAIERTVELTVTDIALAVGEKIILAGKVQMRGGANRMLLARFTRSGNPDLSFDGKGYLLSNLDGAADLEPRSVIADPFGNILVGGWALFEAPPSESPPQDAPADTSDLFTRRSED
ncbi:MAG: hypothetical protein H6628_07265 [Calditrichae bacterium]|nr:hypothetical protein [Calditrichia bacterium]